ncbi:MAG: DUF3153 domain-containing protein [Cuspidothrix sp.]
MNVSTPIQKISQSIKSALLAITKINPIAFIVVFISLMLSGCINYDLGVNFNSTNNGQLVQHIQVAEKITIFSSDYISEWLKTLENRARKLSGSIERVSATEIIVKIPFSSAKELQDKFTEFYQNSSLKIEDRSQFSNITANLTAEDTNFFLFSRNHLVYDLDLRSLGMFITKADNSFLNLDFSLNAPWGIKNINNNENILQPEKHGNQLIWQLQLGAINHVEVVFWLPNFLGMGTLIIIGFVWLGIYLRYTVLPMAKTQTPDVHP